MINVHNQECFTLLSAIGMDRGVLYTNADLVSLFLTREKKKKGYEIEPKTRKTKKSYPPLSSCEIGDESSFYRTAAASI